MHAPIMHKGYLFVAQSHTVLCFNPNGDRALDFIDWYSFPDEVIGIEKYHDDLRVETKYATYMIVGGPSAAQMYSLLWSRR